MSIDRVYAPRLFRYVTVTPTVLNADAYDANDVIFDSTEIPLAAWKRDEPIVLNDIVYFDASANTVAVLTFWFFSSAIATFGTKDAAPSISDADSQTFLGKAVMPTANMLATTNNTIGSLHNLSMLMKPAAGTTSVYFAMTSAGTPTHATSGVQVRLGFIA